MADEPSAPRKRTRTPTSPSAAKGGTPRAAKRTQAEPATSFEAAEAAAALEAEVEAEATAPTAPAPAAPAPAASRGAVPRTARLADAPSTPPLQIRGGGVGEVSADSVEVRLGGIGALDGNEVFVQWGGVGAAKAERVGVEFGSVGAALAREVSVSQGFAGAVVAREVVVEQAIARTVVARDVRFSRPSAVLVLIAAKVEGEVRPLLDWRGALAAGAALGLVLALVRTAREAARTR
jgi:hypothetical protein